MSRTPTLLKLIAAVFLGCSAPSAANDIRVLSAGAIEPGIAAAASAFQRETGHTVLITFDTAPRIRARVNAGEQWDAVVASAAVADELTRAGKLLDQRVVVGQVGLGVAIRADAPIPDISTKEALTQSILNAESIVFNRASTGLYFESLLEKLAIAEQVAARSTRYPDGAAVMEHLLAGKGREMGVGAITEIRLFGDRGLRLVGPLPPDVQNYTAYAGAPVVGGPQMETATAFVRYLGSPAGSALFQAAGIEPAR